MYAAFTRHADASSDDASLLTCLIASCRFVLRGLAARADAGGGDAVDAIIMAATVEANVRRATARADYAAFDQPVPDSLREPVSTSQLAARTGLARETVRRRLEALETRGRCLRTGSGYLVPLDVLVGDSRRGVAVAAFEGLRRLTQDVSRAQADVVPERVVQVILSPLGPESPIRAANRAAGSYSVDVFREMARLTGDHEAALIYMALLEAVREDGQPRYLAALALARSLDRPMESVRRRLAALVESGLAVRGPHGFKARREVGASDELRSLALANMDLIRRMYRVAVPRFE